MKKLYLFPILLFIFLQAKAVDTTPPVIAGILTTSYVVGCNASDKPVAESTVAALEPFGISISDDVSIDANITVTSVDTQIGSCPITISRTYSIRDEALNTAVITQQIIINTKDFAVPANTGATVSCPDLTNVAPILPVVTDSCGSVLTPSAPVIGPKPACEGTRTYSYVYTGCNGHAHTWVYTYTVERNSFTTPAPGSSTVSCPDYTTFAPTLPTVTDNCGTVLTPGAPIISAFVVCEGPRTYSYPYMDCEGNMAMWVYTYMVERTNFPMPANGGSIVSCPNSTDTPPSLPSITDNCGNLITPTAPIISAKPSCSGTRTYTYTYTDCETNSHNWVYTYTVNDATVPTITGTVTSQSAIPMPGCLFMVRNVKELVRAISTDNCTPTADLTITQVPSAGTIMTTNTTVSVTVTDLCGNSSVTTVDVVLPAKPTITLTSGPTCAINLQTYSLQVTVSSGVVTAIYGTVQGLGANVWEISAIDTLNNNMVTVTDANACTTILPVVKPQCGCPILMWPISGGDKVYSETASIPALTASTLDIGNVLEWYDVPAGGATLGTGTSFTPPSQAVGSTITYYVQSRWIPTDCVSPRTAITITKTAATNLLAPLDLSNLVTSFNSSILFRDCVGEEIQILEITGSVLYSCKIYLTEQAIPVPAKGIYIVKIKGKTLKVLVR